MIPLKNTLFYREVVHELNYSFGNYFLFDGFVVAEINEDVVYSWEHHGQKVTNDINDLLDDDTGHLAYITHRIHSYAVKPTDWLKFFRNGHMISGYAIVSYTKAGYANALLEKLFVKKSLKRFRSLEDAIRWAKMTSRKKAIA